MAKFKMKPFKAITKQLPEALTTAAIRGGGVVGGAFLSNAIVKPAIEKIANEKTKKLASQLEGPGMLLLGTFLEVASNDKKIAALGQGLGAYGALRTAALAMPKEKLGLGEATEQAQPAISWSEVSNALRQVVPASEMQGTNDDYSTDTDTVYSASAEIID